MAGKPTNAFPVAVASLVPPFPPQITFHSLPNGGEFGVVYKDTWTVVPVSATFLLSANSTTGPGATTTANFWWDPNGRRVGWAYTLGSSSIATIPTTDTSVATTPISLAQSTPVQTEAPTTSTQDSTIINSSNAEATSPTSAPSSTPVPSPKESNGLSGGAVAGVAIGCLIAGALIAGLLAWFFLKRRKPARGRDSEASTLALMPHEKGPIANTTSMGSNSPTAVALENGLPQPLEDKALSGEITKISNLIKNHVQSYYHNGRVSPVMIDYDDIQALGSDLPVSVGTLSTLLGNSTTREIALRFCIAWVVVSRMQLNSQPSKTFLPPEVSECLQIMSLADRRSRVHSLFFSKWRAITAELMQSTYVRAAFTASDARLQNIQEASNLLDNILRPYSDSRMEDTQRSRNLEEIIKRSAAFAFTLFSQPSSWDFDWKNEQGVKAGSLCIFPALVQVTDDNGEPIKPPRPFSEATIRRLDE